MTNPDGFRTICAIKDAKSNTNHKFPFSCNASQFATNKLKQTLTLSLSLSRCLPPTQTHQAFKGKLARSLSLSLYLKHTLSLPLSLSHALNTKKKQEACMVGKASPAET